MVLPLGVLVVLAGALGAGASEQTILPLMPPAEQRIELLGSGEEVQDVEAIDDAEVQAVMHHEPPSAAGQTVSTVGKIAAGVAAAALSLGFMVASLLFM